jgi:hypothetical protein
MALKGTVSELLASQDAYAFGFCATQTSPNRQAQSQKGAMWLEGEFLIFDIRRRLSWRLN